MASHAPPVLSRLSTPARSSPEREPPLLRQVDRAQRGHKFCLTQLAVTRPPPQAWSGTGARSPRQTRGCLEPDSTLPEGCFGLRSEDEQDSTGAQGWKGLREEKLGWLKALGQEGGLLEPPGEARAQARCPAAPGRGSVFISVSSVSCIELEERVEGLELLSEVLPLPQLLTTHPGPGQVLGQC